MKAALALILVVAACGDDGGDSKCSIPGSGPGLDPTGAMCERLSSYRLFDDIAI